jgi:hypothetical protein
MFAKTERQLQIATLMTGGLDQSRDPGTGPMVTLHAMHECRKRSPESHRLSPGSGNLSSKSYLDRGAHRDEREL